jgi:phosphatidylinositol 3-kinase
MIMLHFSWNEWLTLPVQFNDLPRTAQLALTIYDCTGPNKLWPVGGTTISLFSKHGLFRQVNFKNIVKKKQQHALQGMVDLRVFPNCEADGSYPTTTSGKAKDHGKEQMQRLTKLTKKHRNGHMTKVQYKWKVDSFNICAS